MGALHEMTIDELRETYEKSERTWQIAWGKAGNTDFAKNRVAQPHEISRMVEYYGEAKAAKSPRKAPVKTRTPKKDISNFSNTVSIHSSETPGPLEGEVQAGWDWKRTASVARNIVFYGGCLLIVVGHAILIWYDCAVQWGVPGMIGGCLAFVIVAVALAISTDPTKNRTSQNAVGFVFVVDVLAWWVHYPTFRIDATIGAVETGVLCAFLCCCSWVALWLFRDSKLS